MGWNSHPSIAGWAVFPEAAAPYEILFWIAIFALVGAVLGSFLGLVSIRYPKGQAIALGRSACSTCGRTLHPLDLLPIISFLLLRGRCRTCKAGIERRYIVFEVAAAVIGIASAMAFPHGQALAAAVLGWWLLLLAALDLEHYWLPNRLTYPLILSGLVAAGIFEPSRILHHLAGAAIGFLLLSLVRIVYRRLRGREGLGGGDAKLFAAAGAWVGWQDLPLVLLAAAASALAGAILLHRHKEEFLAKPLPFGLFLAPAIWLVYLLR